MDPAVRSMLFQTLGVSGQATIQSVSGFHGGLNRGVWILKSGGEDLVLKLVQAAGPSSEADNFIAMQREFPIIVGDPAVAFPRQIVHVLGVGGAKVHDLIVMPRAPGESLGHVIQAKWHAGKVAQALDLLEKVGACVGGFHRRYADKQHCDLQPQNIMCDEGTGRITLIDMGGMGGPVLEKDVDHFLKAFGMLAGVLGPQLEIQGRQRFEQGYAQTNRSRRMSI